MVYDIILEPVFRFIFTLPPPTPGLIFVSKISIIKKLGRRA